ncbi:anhydro-N-acetylmuramic acid kinase [Solimonas variicoloris]|uniref:anhydro-N-acetylmuramic acid kinase n=1 Tax=Solimonas variicoloris TaxID=254408 RepID=UPI000375CF36|nr:anhydro-N-acetylmuramic acid kinase [Solimonas variicoloris]
MGVCIGLMSGTSLDAIDAAACEFSDDAQWRRLIGTRSHRYPAAVREELLALQRRPDTPITLRDVARLDAVIGDSFAEAAAKLMGDLGLSATDVTAIGSHGQTVFHDPTSLHTTTQLGDPNRIAARTGVRTVADLRRADMAHGGHGAPLMPAFHHALFADAYVQVVANIGGIANITVLPGSGGGDVFGFDTGPGNALLDDWAQHHLGVPYDRDGAWAASGSVDTALLQHCLADPYFARPAPKSTGRDYFNLDWLHARGADLGSRAAADVQRTLLQLTVESLARAIEARAPAAERLLVCGGGARNRILMERLNARLPRLQVADTGIRGLDPDWVEAAGFAWLAQRTVLGLSGNLPSVTGAARPVILGGIYSA